MTSRRPRGLRPDELDLWRKATEKTTPLPKSIRPKKSVALKGPTVVEPKAAAKTFQIGQARRKAAPTHDLAGSISDQLGQRPVQMDPKSFTKLKKGKLAPERRLDLHGMTLVEAHPALTSFIMSAYADQKRLVLVITGKGRDRDDSGPIPTPRGVLKHQVPQWLKSRPLASMILQITEAHIRHGGSGAYYIYLRRQR